MIKFIVEVLDIGLKAIEAADGGGCYSLQTWIQNAVNEKERRSVDTLVEKYTNKNAQKIPYEDKLVIIDGLTLETAKERTDALIK